MSNGADAGRIPDDEIFECIGRVEGEEQQAKARAQRFEIDTGEVLKAVTGV